MLTTLTDAENDARPRPHFPLSGRVCRKKRSLGILIRHLRAILVSRRQDLEVVNGKRAISKAQAKALGEFLTKK
jgi:hypothetical protein